MESGHNCTRNIEPKKTIGNPLKLGVLVVFHDDKTPTDLPCGCTCHRVFAWHLLCPHSHQKSAAHNSEAFPHACDDKLHKNNRYRIWSLEDLYFKKQSKSLGYRIP